MGIGTNSEGVSQNTTVIRDRESGKNRFSTIHEEEDEEMSPKRPSVNYNVLTNSESYHDQPEINRKTTNHDDMIAPPSMDRRLETSGDKFYSSYNPSSTDKERFNRSSYDKDQPDSFNYQQSVVNVR